MTDRLWLTDPAKAFAAWQEIGATGVDGRPFSSRSIIQHQAMFEAVLEHLAHCGQTLATFHTAELEAFLAARGLDRSSSTAKRYAKLFERLGRHLVTSGVRAENPGKPLSDSLAWPLDDPAIAFLPPAFDTALQQWVQPSPNDDRSTSRDKAAIALFLGAGLTVAEARQLPLAGFERALPGALARVRTESAGGRLSRIAIVEGFAQPPVLAWIAVRASHGYTGELLLAFRRTGKRAAVISLWRAVHDALVAIGYRGVESGPQALRNTYGRRLLLRGLDPKAAAERLGLSSARTTYRLRQTISASS
ncbi:hypothetical protein BKK79_37370 (plasmid) [Cupriavidus sp. USMAA2-4]|uniref:site-specific integrase n=1 Tax=Cupriavidus sp. USMAA2-4 TaxID=876364 RepID=UPI0008A6987F|nr:site-specific integrase [Cupriavidus sp. USMAA2-4]AOY97607.1 hypothetical protein BKK79_37370 [Cupriavidus sp. USMAA2-4]